MTLRTGNKGLTLIEVLLAVAILGIGIVSVLRAYAGSIAALEAGRLTMDEANLARQKMVEVEQMILAEEKISKTSDQGTFEDPFQEFSWEWEIEPVEPEGLNTLTLQVSYQNDPRTIALRTYVVDKKTDEEKKEE